MLTLANLLLISYDFVTVKEVRNTTAHFLCDGLNIITCKIILKIMTKLVLLIDFPIHPSTQTIHSPLPFKFDLFISIIGATVLPY